MIDNHARPTKLLWVDLEMTGLDPDTCVILEIVAKVTDFDFNTLAEYQAIVAQPDDVLENVDAWNKEHHTSSGLFDRVRAEGRPSEEIQQELAAFIKQWFGEERAVLAGNSIHQDRRFIRKWWPAVDQLLHYRMLDVSSWKVLMQGKYDVQFEKKEAHRALDDIDESIAELGFYLEWLDRQSATSNN